MSMVTTLLADWDSDSNEGNKFYDFWKQVVLLKWKAICWNLDGQTKQVEMTKIMFDYRGTSRLIVDSGNSRPLLFHGREKIIDFLFEYSNTKKKLHSRFCRKKCRNQVISYG